MLKILVKLFLKNEKKQLSVATYGIRFKISFAYEAYEGAESPRISMKKLNEISLNAITVVKRNDNQKYSYN